MAQFFQIKSINGDICYVNRDKVTDIMVSPQPIEVTVNDQPVKGYTVNYSFEGCNAEGMQPGMSSFHLTLEEAKAEARKIAEGRTCDEISEAD